MQILTDWSPYFNQATYLVYLLRQVGWLMLRGLVYLCNACETLLDSFYGTLNFFAADSVQEFIAGFKPVIWILFGISLIMLFYMLIVKGRNERNGILVNILLAVLIVSSLPTVMTELNSLTYAGISYVRTSTASTGEQIVQSGVDDLLLINELNFDLSAFENHTITNADGIDYRTGNNIMTDRIMNINVSEIIDPNKLDKKDYKAVFENRLTVDSNGTQSLSEIPSPPLGIEFLGGYYFRYRISWLPLFISLISMILAVFFTGYKTVRLTFELAVFEFMAPLIAVTDISTGERIKQMLRAIFSTYAVLFFTSALLKLYMMAVYFFNNALADTPIAMAFAQLFVAIAVIDGPNLFERIFGIDIGLSSGIRNTVAVLHGTKMVAHTVSRTVTAPVRAFSRMSSHRHTGSLYNTEKSENDTASGTHNGSHKSSHSANSGISSGNYSVEAETAAPSSSPSPAINTPSGYDIGSIDDAVRRNTPDVGASPDLHHRNGMNLHIDAARQDAERLLEPKSMPEHKSPWFRRRGDRK